MTYRTICIGIVIEQQLDQTQMVVVCGHMQWSKIILSACVHIFRLGLNEQTCRIQTAPFSGQMKRCKSFLLVGD